MHMGPMHNKSIRDLLQTALYYEEIEKKADFETQNAQPPRRVFHV